MTPVYAYVRFSTKAQEGNDSLDRQTQLINDLAGRKGWSIPDNNWMRDLGRSAWKGDHLRVGALGKFKEQVDAGLIAPGTVLVVENLDRLSREEVKKARRWLEDVTDRGVLIATCTPERIYNEASLSGDNLVEIIEILSIAKRANEESTTKGGRVRTKWEKKKVAAAQGVVMTRQVPGWLEVRDGTIHVLPDRAALVCRIYEMALAGHGQRHIARVLNDERIPPWGRWHKAGSKPAWDGAVIQAMLLSPAVQGEYHPRSRVNGIMEATGVIVRDYYPSGPSNGLPDADLIARAREAVKGRRGTGGAFRTTYKNLFIGLSRCKSCGGGMVVRGSKKGYSYFSCQDAWRKAGCTNDKFFSYNVFEKAALDRILHLALDDGYFTRGDDIAPMAIRVAELQRQLENLQTEEGRLLQILRKRDSAAIERELENIEGEKAQVQISLAEANDNLARARGAVSPQEHIRRVVEVRDALNSDDEAARLDARMRVSEAIKAVVSYVECDPMDTSYGEPQKTMTLVLNHGAAGLKIDAQGNELASFDLHGSTEGPLGFQRGLTGGELANNAPAVQAVRRRKRAAG